MRVLGKPTSINVRKVLWTCAVLGIPYEAESWGSGTERSCSDAAFLQLNPNGMVPVIVDDGVALWESNTICRYLAGKHGRSDLLPVDPLQRAQVEKWMDWQIAELNGAWRHAFLGLVRKSAAFADADGIALSEANWHRHMALLDRRLQATGAYVTGAQFTLADIVLGLSTNRWLSAPLTHPPLPALHAWYARLAQHNGFTEHCANGVP